MSTVMFLTSIIIYAVQHFYHTILMLILNMFDKVRHSYGSTKVFDNKLNYMIVCVCNKITNKIQAVPAMTNLINIDIKTTFHKQFNKFNNKIMYLAGHSQPKKVDHFYNISLEVY